MKTRGYTLVEVMVVTAISAFVFAGVLSAYIFLGRGLVREANSEQMESGARTAIYYFTKDLGAAESITAQTSMPQITLTILAPVPPSTTAGYPIVPITVTYSYDSVNMLLTRNASNGVGPQALLSPAQSGLTGLNLMFAYYDINGVAIASIPATQTVPQTNIKQVLMTYTATTGSTVSGARSSYSVSSPLVIMKNKLSIQ